MTKLLLTLNHHYYLMTHVTEYCAYTYVRGVDEGQGPVVQSVVSLTSSLRVISLTVLVDSKHDILIFLAEKNAKLLTFFQQKISAYLRIT